MPRRERSRRFSFSQRPHQCAGLNDPGHYAGLCTVPMQDTDAAIRELDGHRTRVILNCRLAPTSTGLTFRRNDSFHFLKRVSAWGWQSVTVGRDGQRADGKILAALVGRYARRNSPCGKLDDLRWGVGTCCPTCGSCSATPAVRSSPHWVGLSTASTADRFGGRRQRCQPRDYLGKFWIDGITHDADLLEYVLKLQGANRICMGSDYPFPLGDLELGGYMLDMGLEEDQLNQLISGRPWNGSAFRRRILNRKPRLEFAATNWAKRVLPTYHLNHGSG